MSIRYSVVIPVYDEEGSVRELERSIRDVMDRRGESYEIIFVDDGSRDRTPFYLKELKRKNPFLNIITFKENSGQTASLRAGFDAAGGDIVISMDGDLQNDPLDIPILLNKLREGYDAVCGWRRKRYDSMWKKAASKFANVVQKAVFKSHLHDISCTLRVYNRSAIKELDLGWKGAHRFIPYLLLKNDKKISEVRVKHNPRKFGKSKYKPTKIFSAIKGFFRVLFIKKGRA